MQQMEVADYVNERPRCERKASGATNLPERRICQLLLLGFGVLFIIQATLNVSLRLTSYSECNATDVCVVHKHVKEVEKHYDGRIPGHCNRLQERFNALTREKNQLENRNTELTNMLQRVEGERGRLKINLRELNSCGSSQCPPDWRTLNSRCYFLSTEKKTWEDSRKYCQSKDADLVVINNQQEQMNLYRLDGDVYLLFWIGLYNTTGTTRWEWVDGSELTTQFWQSGQPERFPSNVEDCVEMYHHNPVLASWNDAPCGAERRWLCEKDPCQLP